MMGRNHLVAGAATCVAAASAGRMILDSETAALAPARDRVSRLVSDYVLVGDWFGTRLVWAAGAAILFMLGALLPDIDSPNSTISSALGFSLPIPHRRVTHSIWPCALLLWLGLRFRCLMWLLAGYASHLLLDKPSAAGVCLLWPLTRYRTYPGGAFVARGHKLKLYRAGEASETVFVILAWVVALVLAWAAFRPHLAAVISR